MSSNRGETDREHLLSLDKPEDQYARTNSTSIKEVAGQMRFPAIRPEHEIENVVGDQGHPDDGIECDALFSNDKIDRGKKQMMSVLLITIMLVLISVTFSQSLSSVMIKKYDNPNPISQDILIVYMLVGILVIGAMFLHKDAITEAPDEGNGHDGDNQHDGDNRQVAGKKIKYILRDHLSIVGMTFFFPFACILDLSHIIAAVGCDGAWRYSGDECYRRYLIDMFYHLIRILFMAAELAFCCKFHRTRFKEIGMVRCGIMIVMAGNLGLWFLSLVYESGERDFHQEGFVRKCSNESDHTSNHEMPLGWKACVREKSSAHKVMHGMNRYLYPFAIEFSLLVGEFLLTKFISRTKPKAEGFRKSSSTEGNVDFVHPSQPSEDDAVVVQHHPTPSCSHQDLRRSSQVNVVLPEPSTSRTGQVLWVFIIGIGLLSSFLYISVAFIDSFAKGRNSTDIDSVNWEYVYETYSMINYILINVLMVIGYVCGCSFEIQEKKLHGLDWLVLISSFGPFMRELITVSAIAASDTEMSPHNFPAILICNRLVDWVQLILQAPFIFLSERWRLTERQRNQPRYLCQERILKAIIFCLAVTNLMNWISDSIILTDSFSVRKELIDSTVVFDNWKIVERISLPLMIFYRFNSFLLFTRAYLGD